MKNMTHYVSVCAAAVLLLATSACDAPPTSKLPHVRQETVSHAVIFADNVTRLTPAEQGALGEFVAPVSVSAVTFAGLAADDRNPRAVARARAIRDYLVSHGFRADTIHMQPTPGMDGRTVVLSFEYAKGVPPAHCPDWSGGSMHNYDNYTSSDFGCSYYNNIITQLADPNDYNGAHALPVADGPRDSAYLQKYLSGAAQAGSSGGSSSGSSGGGSTSTTTSSP